MIYLFLRRLTVSKTKLGWFGFFVYWHINFHGLFNPSIGQQWHYSTHSLGAFTPFPKVNATGDQTRYDVTV